MKRYLNKYNLIAVLILLVLLKLILSIFSYIIDIREENYSAYYEYKNSINEECAQQVYAKHLYYLNGEQ